MNLQRIYFVFIILWTCAACQTSGGKPDDSPTLPSATLPARALPTRQPTLTPRLIDNSISATPENSCQGTQPCVPTSTAEIPCQGAQPCAPTSMDNPLIIEEPTLPPLAATLPSTLNAPDAMVIGHSAEGNPLTVQRFGSGERILLLIGGIHGGWEANTVTLMEALMDHFRNTPEDVLPGLTIMIMPVANPDGLAYGRIARGRFNGDGVDLNRNWSCEWSRDAFWRQERVNPGVTSFSEPESVALANFLLQVRPAAALFYHSAANGVFAGNCGGDHGSAAMAAVLGKAAGYGYDAPFTAYPVTGVASNWADGQGIPSADVELQTSTDSEYDRNLRGIMALQAWIAR